MVLAPESHERDTTLSRFCGFGALLFALMGAAGFWAGLDEVNQSGDVDWERASRGFAAGAGGTVGALFLGFLWRVFRR